MFEYVRTHQRLMQFVLLLFIVPSFAFVGIQSYISGDTGTVLAKVAGQSISQQEFDDSLREQMNRLRQMYGAQFDESLFSTPEAKQDVLDNLVGQHAIKAEVLHSRIMISDQALQQHLLATPGLSLPDGSFDNAGYKRALAAQGMTPAGYESRLREDLAIQQLTSVLQTSAFTPKTVATQVSLITQQERAIQALNFSATDFASKVVITDAKLHDYYDKNSAEFMLPETAKIEYVVFSGESIAEQMTASDEEIKGYYDQNQKNYAIPEQRRASHILIKVKKDASATEKAAAKAKIDALLLAVRKTPADFAKIAKENSQDGGSAVNGGDLDFFSKGMMVKPFEDAAYQLKQGEISDVVESDFGYHIIQLTAIKPGSIKTLEQAKADIAADIKKQKAAKKYSELAETFTNTVYEQTDSLKAVADKLKLTIQTADKVTRVADPASASNPVMSNPKFLKALFTDDTIKNKRNSDAVEIAPGTLAAGRIVDYKPTTKRAFSDVKDIVTVRVTLLESALLAQNAGQAKLAALKLTPDTAGFSPEKIVSRDKQADVSPEALSQVMKADTRKLPAFVGVDLPGRGYVVYRINKIQQPVVDAAHKSALEQQINNMTASEELAAYIALLKKKAKTTILKPFVTAKAVS